jgi:hypothetical protein
MPAPDRIAHYDAIVRSLVADRTWICASDVGVAATHEAARLIELGGRAMALATRRGTGDLPEGVPLIDLDIGPSASMTEGIRTAMAALRSLPDHALEALDAFDPKREARVILPLFGDRDTIGGRRVFGARRREWVALEDKTKIDAFWDAAGVTRAPSEIAPAEWPDAWKTARRLDAGSGTAWVADNREGWHGGAECLRWVRDEKQAREAMADLSAMADRLRVMPFLQGLPCSIHGIVFPDRIISLRPVEMIILRRPGNIRLHYSQAGTFWEPGDAVTTEMRSVARRVGEHLRATVDYRGAFTVDGVLTSDGFLPTELNPRFGAGLFLLTRGLEGLWVYFIHLALVEGIEADWRPDDLEALVLEHSAGHRLAGGMVHFSEPRTETTKLHLRYDGSVWSPGDEPGDATVSIGPGPMGGIALVRLNPETTPVGPPSAPRVAGVIRFLDRHLSLGIGAVEPAVSGPASIRSTTPGSSSRRGFRRGDWTGW